MEKYFFTFMQNQFINEFRLKDYWVEVTAPSYGQARDLFITYITIPYFNKPSDFAFQYTEKDFERKHFKNGCLLELRHGNIDIEDSIINQLNKKQNGTQS